MMIITTTKTIQPAHYQLYIYIASFHYRQKLPELNIIIISYFLRGYNKRAPGLTTMKRNIKIKNMRRIDVWFSGPIEWDHTTTTTPLTYN